MATASSTASSTAATGIPNISSLVASASSAATQTSSSSISVISGAPSLTSTSISQLFTGLPTLSGYYSYAAPTVPPRSGAPYLQEIALPQNFVFIVVGAVIAFFAACLLAWRFLAAWSVNRNLQREGAGDSMAYTPLNNYTSDVKSGMRGGGGSGGYGDGGNGNGHKRKSTLMSINLNAVSGNYNNNNNKEGGAGAPEQQGHDMADLSHTLPKSFGNSVPSLFFSPTAEVARQSMIRPSSQYMPGGHYRDVSK